MLYATLIMVAMGVFVAASAAAFAWAVLTGQFRELDRAASSIFWDEQDEERQVPRG